MIRLLFSSKTSYVNHCASHYIKSCNGFTKGYPRSSKHKKLFTNQRLDLPRNFNTVMAANQSRYFYHNTQAGNILLDYRISQALSECYNKEGFDPNNFAFKIIIKKTKNAEDLIYQSFLKQVNYNVTKPKYIYDIISRKQYSVKSNNLNESSDVYNVYVRRMDISGILYS